MKASAQRWQLKHAKKMKAAASVWRWQCESSSAKKKSKWRKLNNSL